MKKMNQQEFMNILCILAKMDERCADRIIKSTQQSFIEVKSASDFTKQYESVCVDDLYFNYMFDRMDVPQAAEEVINRITKAKQVVMKTVQEEQKVIGIDGNHVLDILDRIMHDADNMPPEEPEEPEEPKEPATPVVQPVLTRPVMSKKESSFDDMLSALEDEDEEEVGNTSTAPEPNDPKKPDTSDDLYNAFDDEDSDLLSALEEEEDGIAEQNPAESDNDETEEEPEETQEEEPEETPEEEPEETQEEEPEETQKEQSDGLSLDESNGEPDDSVNLCSPSLSVSESGNEELCSELSPVLDERSKHTDGQPNCSGSDCLLQSFPDGKPGRGLPSIDDTEEGQEKESVAMDAEQEMKDAFAKILNFKYRPSSSEEEEAKEIFDTLVKGASRNFFAKPASIKYDVKEEAKKPVNPNGNVSLGDVIAAALGMPEAGKLDTDTGDTGDDFDL